MKLGDRVTWTSQSGGFTKTKTGTIIEVVPPQQIPKSRSPSVWGGSRGHESYVVSVNGKNYWPKVNKLTLCDASNSKPYIDERDAIVDQAWRFVTTDGRGDPPAEYRKLKQMLEHHFGRLA